MGKFAVIKLKSSPEEKDDYADLLLIECQNCHLVQLSNTVPPERLFSEFHYLSGIDQSMNNAFFDVVKDVESRVDLKPGDIVVDISSNDGTLLSYYRHCVETIGFEPANNILEKYGHRIRGYFSAKEYWNFLFPRTSKAKVITAIAMFCDLYDPNSFCKDVHDILDEDGIFVIQMNDSDSMIQNCSIDNICHEYLCYYSIDTLLPLLRRNCLYPDSVSYNTVNGGSIRVICRHTENQKPFLRYSAAEATLDTVWKNFKKERDRLCGYIDRQLKQHKSIWAYGASTRGNSLLQLLGLDSTKITAIADRNRKKWSKFTAGGNIPIKSEEHMRQVQPDNLFVLPYYFEKEFLAREQEYLSHGGRMLFPLPRFRIWTMKGDVLTVHGLH
ncbi:MAG: methyltransferase domain-containing protein [Candidatus Nitrosopolaris sp.]